MTEAPAFFVPRATPENQEELYAGFAKWCNMSVPKQAERIYSITYIHNSEEWTATVGEPLRGTRCRPSRSQGKGFKWFKSSPRTIQLSDPAIVLAIFPGNLFMVVTNHRIAENVGSAWENPFFVGQPTSISYFSVAQ